MRPNRLFFDDKNNQYFYMIGGKKKKLKVPKTMTQRQVQKINIINILPVPKKLKRIRKKKKAGPVLYSKNFTEQLELIPQLGTVFTPAQNIQNRLLPVDLKKADTKDLEKKVDDLIKNTPKLTKQNIEDLKMAFKEQIKEIIELKVKGEKPKFFSEVLTKKFSEKPDTKKILEDLEKKIDKLIPVNIEKPKDDKVEVKVLEKGDTSIPLPKPSIFSGIFRRKSKKPERKQKFRGDPLNFKQKFRDKIKKIDLNIRDETLLASKDDFINLSQMFYLDKGFDRETNVSELPTFVEFSEYIRNEFPDEFNKIVFKPEDYDKFKDDALEEYKKYLEQVGAGKYENYDDGLWSDEMEDILEKKTGLFVPVLASDNVEEALNYVEPNDKKFAMVVNTEPEKSEGRHWTCCFFDNRDDFPSVEYFDSLVENGGKPPIALLKVMRKICEIMNPEVMFLYKQNMVKRQDDDTSNCGFHVIDFIDKRNRGVPFHEATGFDEIIDNSEEGEEEIEKFKSYL